MLKEIYGKVAGTHPVVDFKKELSLWDTVIEANKLNLLESAKDINIGGIAISAAKMAVVSNMGCDIRIALENEQDIFSESLSRAIVEIKPQNIEAFDKLASSMGITYVSAGKTGGDTFSVNNLYKKLNTISDIYFNKFKEVIEQDL